MWTETRYLKLSRDSPTISDCNDGIYQARIMMRMDQRSIRGGGGWGDKVLCHGEPDKQKGPCRE